MLNFKFKLLGVAVVMVTEVNQVQNEPPGDVASLNGVDTPENVYIFRDDLSSSAILPDPFLTETDSRGNSGPDGRIGYVKLQAAGNSQKHPVQDHTKPTENSNGSQQSKCYLIC